MDHSKLAAQLLDKLQSLHRARPQKNIDEALQGEAFVLHYMARRTEDVQPGEIGAETGVSSARVAQTLNSMEKKGQITRQIDVDDRRRILVRLTPEGRSAAEAHLRHVLGLVSKILGLLGEADAREYVRITGKLADILSANDGQS